MSKFHHRRTSRNGARRIAITFIVLLTVLLSAVFVIRHNFYKNLKPVSDSQTSILVTVEKGSTASEIAEILKNAGLIRQTWAFEWYVRNTGLRGKLQAGSYYLQPSQSTPEIVDVLTKGRVATDMFTILPGKRIDQIKSAMVNAGFDYKEVEDAFNPALYAGNGALVDKPPQASLEGYLYPETFQVSPNTKPTEIIKSSLDEMQKRLTPEIRAGITKQGITVHEGVILASVVEKEVGNTSDRPTVAQVFLSRLRQNMPLQSDATTSYGAILAGKIPTHDFDSLYNTYKHKGLPPGPISNVGGTSLSAVAKPSGTDYLYFVAGNDCKTRFSKTLKDHEELIKNHGVGCK